MDRKNMKTMKKIYTVMALLAMFALTSCIEETFPEEGAATAEQVGASAAALEGALNGIPAQMAQGYYVYGAQVHETDMAYPQFMIAQTEMLGDMYPLGTNSGYDWYRNYNTIDRNFGETSYFAYLPWFHTSKVSAIFLCSKTSPASNTPASSGSQNKAVAVRITMTALPPENDVQKNNTPAAAVMTMASTFAKTPPTPTRINAAAWITPIAANRITAAAFPKTLFPCKLVTVFILLLLDHEIIHDSVFADALDQLQHLAVRLHLKRVVSELPQALHFNLYDLLIRFDLVYINRHKHTFLSAHLVHLLSCRSENR